MTRIRVGIVGSYGGLNLGDEAILHGIVALLKSEPDVEITVFSRNPEDTLRRHDVAAAVPVRRMNREEVRAEVASLDALILGGGGILFDEEAKIFIREAALAQELGIPVMVYAVSAGPLKDPEAQSAVRDCLDRADVITVRDKGAQHLLEEIGVQREIRLTADPALLLEPEPLPEDALKREGLEIERGLVGMSIREPGPAAPDIVESHYHQILANTADYIVERFGVDIVFVPMEQENRDFQQSHAVISQMANASCATVLKGQYSPRQLLTLMNHFEFAVGMRLHFLIFAALQGVPFVALPYAGKVVGFLDDLEIQMPPLKNINAGRLIAHVDHAWDLRRGIAGRIKAGIPALIARARDNHEIFMELVRRPSNNPRRRHAAARAS